MYDQRCKHHPARSRSVREKQTHTKSKRGHDHPGGELSDKGLNQTLHNPIPGNALLKKGYPDQREHYAIGEVRQVARHERVGHVGMGGVTRRAASARSRLSRSK